MIKRTATGAFRTGLHWILEAWQTIPARAPVACLQGPFTCDALIKSHSVHSFHAERITRREDLQKQMAQQGVALLTAGEELARLTRLMLCFTSYTQHGGNAGLMLVEFGLNAIPIHGYMLGYVGLWSALFTVWAVLWHHLTGLWLYPFLNWTKPWAPIAYVGLFLGHWAFFGWVAVVQGRFWVLHNCSRVCMCLEGSDEANGLGNCTALALTCLSLPAGASLRCSGSRSGCWVPGEMSIRREQSSNSTVSKQCWSFDIPI